MFCPNCGTKNADTEAKCAQCGFDLQAKAPQARFKGTMVMAPTAAKPAPATPGATAAGGAAPAAPAAAKSGSLKGTMIGVAPPEMARALEEAKAKAAAQAAATSAQPSGASPAAAGATKPSLKGTMIGVAPPDMQAAIAAAKAKMAGAETPSPAGPAAAAPGAAAPAAPAPAAPAAAASPAAKPSIKGTMIGVAPPDMQAAIAAHKAELEKRAAEAATEPPPAPKPTSPLGRASNSKLKGTMIGVAPPDVSQAIAGAKAAAEAKVSPAHAATPPATPAAGAAAAAAGRPAPNPDFAATMVGTAAPITESLRPGPTASRSPSGSFGGTMVGATSPLVENEADAEHIPDGPDSRAAGNSDHPAAFASTSLSEVSEIAAARANLQRVMAEAEATPRPPNGREIPTGAQSPAALRSAAQASQKNALPVLLLGLALLIVAVLIGIALLKRPKTAEEAPKPAPAATP